MLASRSFVAAIPPIILLPGSSYPRQLVVETTDFQLLTIGIVYVCFLRPRSSLIRLTSKPLFPPLFVLTANLFFVPTDCNLVRIGRTGNYTVLVHR